MFKCVFKRYIVPLALLVFIALLGTSNMSCSRRVYPSGLEANLDKSRMLVLPKERHRNRVAVRDQRRKDRSARKAKRPANKIRNEVYNNQERLIKEHYNRQTPDVQARMKLSLIQAKKNNPPTKTKFLKKVVFWKKNKCSDGS